ncbi:MAG: hypothetical protein M1319_00130 [Chloroflexi bacterium]|nr:hypothetical protein [Chloroflexota bacterium]
MTQVRIVSDVRGFADFVSSLWGLIAAATVFLAFINSIIGVIPLHSSHAAIGHLLATLVAFFALLYSFTERLLPVGFMALRNALGRFGFALASLAVYLILAALYDKFFMQTGDFADIASTVISAMSVISYAAFFGLLTAAFGALAVIEFTSQKTGPRVVDAEEDID